MEHFEEFAISIALTTKLWKRDVEDAFGIINDDEKETSIDCIQPKSGPKPIRDELNRFRHYHQGTDRVTLRAINIQAAWAEQSTWRRARSDLGLLSVYYGCALF